MTLFEDTTPAKKKPSKRREHDRYLTPPLATQALLDAFPEIAGTLLFDPCCGDGRMARQIGNRFLRVLLNDLCAADPMQHLDATRPESWAKWGARRRLIDAAWVATNPPFCHASSIAWQALEAGFHVALLLRITWLEAVDERQWLTRRPPTTILVLPRIDFIGAGSTDGATYAWMIWAEGVVKPGIQVVRAEDVGQLKLTGAL